MGRVTTPPDEKELTGRQKMALVNLGKCKSLRCSDGCDAFLFDHKLDGFDICACGHTQDVHENKGYIA